MRVLPGLKWIFVPIIAMIAIALTGCLQLKNHIDPGSVMVASISSDGQYVITTNGNAVAILWDLKDKTKRIISYNANIYSAYFMKNTHDFMWQDLRDYVHVDNIDGKEILRFHNFPTYGEVMTPDLKHYFASDVEWNVYAGYGKNQTLIKRDSDGFVGYGKLFNLTLSDDNKLLLTSGWGSGWDKEPLVTGKNAVYGNYHSISQISTVNGVVLWDVNSGTTHQKISRHYTR